MLLGFEHKHIVIGVANGAAQLFDRGDDVDPAKSRAVNGIADGAAGVLDRAEQHDFHIRQIVSDRLSRLVRKGKCTVSANLAHIVRSLLLLELGDLANTLDSQD